MSKRIIAILLAAVMVFALTACGQEAAAPEPTTTTPAAPATSTPAAPAATPAPADTPAAAETPAKDAQRSLQTTSGCRTLLKLPSATVMAVISIL